MAMPFEPLAVDTEAHLGTRKEASPSSSGPLVDFLLEKQASEPSKANSLEEKQASECLVVVDSLPEQASKSPPINTLPGKQDLTPLVVSSSPGKHASAPHGIPSAPENGASGPPGVDFLPEKHASVPVFTRSKELELSPEKKPVVEMSTRNQASESSSTEGVQQKPKLLPEKTNGGISIASHGYEPSSSRAVRAEIDTAAPFESVKEAVMLFGEGMDWKTHTQILDQERQVPPGFDVHKAYEEIVRSKELLISEEASIADILLELEKAKEQIRVCKGKVPIILANEGAFPPLNQPEEVLNVGVPKEQHMNVLHELEMTKKEIEGVNEERSLLEGLKRSALKECEAAMSAQYAASIRVEELMAKHASSQEALVAAKAALTETEAQIDMLRSVPEGELDCKFGSASYLLSDPKSAILKTMELNLSEADTLIKKLKEELATLRGVSVANSEGELTRVKLKLEHAKAAEGESVAALGRALEELDEVKLNLSKATEDGASLTSSVGILQAEVAMRQAELESAHETEQIACATLASLQDELCSVRALVQAAQASEMKAREAKRTLPIAIKQLASEADEAKAASKVAKEEIRKGKLELEQSKAATNTTLSRLQAAQKEAQAARASEAMAVAEFKALSESEGELIDSDTGLEGGKTAVCIPLEEYRALSDAGHEAQEAGNKMVGAICAQVEEVRASQRDAQAKLDVIIKELETLQKALEEAQKKADDAQREKLSVEAELRKWRAEHEKGRKTGSTPSSVSTSAAQSPRLNAKLGSQGKVVHHSFQGKTVVGLDSLAEVLSLKVPSSEITIRKLPEIDVIKKAEKAKKVTFFARVMSILARRKSKSAK